MWWRQWSGLVLPQPQSLALLPPEAQLSRSFTLGEMTRSGTAARHGWPNQPNAHAINALQVLCEHVLQPARDVHGVISVSSGYRSPRLNRAVKGSRTSDHLTGHAADITPSSNVTLHQLGKWIQENCEFKQLILEYNQWLHVSYEPSNNRCQVLEAYDTGKYRSYQF